MTGRSPWTPPHPVITQMRELRNAAGLSLQQLERQHGMKAMSVGSWERGDRHPPVEQIQRLLDIYGYDLVAVPKARRVNGRPTIRTAADITLALRTTSDMLQTIADQLDPEELAVTEPEG